MLKLKVVEHEKCKDRTAFKVTLDETLPSFRSAVVVHVSSGQLHSYGEFQFQVMFQCGRYFDLGEKNPAQVPLRWAEEVAEAITRTAERSGRRRIG